MADYAAVANQIYDPSLNADKVGLDNSLASTKFSLDSENKDLETTYSQNKVAYGKQKDSQGDNAAFTASSHGLFGSGIASNMQNKVVGDYTTNVDNLETMRSNKLADIAGRRTLAQQGYDTSLGALRGKYQGLKDTYIREQEQHDADVARQNAILAAQQAAYRGGYSGGGSSGGGGGAKGAPTPNYSADQIFGLIHDIRNNKATYHASWGQIAGILSSKGINTAHDSAADKALRRYFGQG